jgi:hypothetical protein
MSVPHGKMWTMTSRVVSDDERRARLAWRHHLTGEAQQSDPVAVARSLVGFHASDPASVYLAAAARTSHADAAMLSHALYDDRSLVRMLGMRRTLFVVPIETMPVVQAASTDDIAARERRRTIQMFADADLAPDPAALLMELEDLTVRALEKHGEATTRQLTEDEPALRQQLTLAQGKRYEAKITVAPRVLFQLGAEGHVVRGRPVKSWVSNYRWALTRHWLGQVAAPVPAELAEIELARRWLHAFGPGTLADLKWWTGWTVAKSKRALAALKAAEVSMRNGETGYVLPDDVDPLPEPEPWVALLPSLDPAVMGWAMAGRDWYLGAAARDQTEPRSGLYDRNGNIGPTVWSGGRVVGGWSQRPDGEVVYRVFDDVGTEARAAIASRAAELTHWLGEVRVTPRFPTPLDKELRS